MSSDARPTRLDRPVEASDHAIGPDDAPMTLVEYGSYACPSCTSAHHVIAKLRDRFGDRLRYVFRHRPIRASAESVPAAEWVEQAALATGAFWPAHDELMRLGPDFAPGQLDAWATQQGLPPRSEQVARRVRDDFESAGHSGALVSPTFFINGRRYEGPWDEAALGEALLGSVGHRFHTASLDFVRWGPATGFLLTLMSVLAVVLFNSRYGAGFEALWHQPFGFVAGAKAFSLPLLDWVNHALLSLFFLVVGLEIKRELTVGRLANRKAAALPVAAALGGMAAPALLYRAIVPDGAWSHGWGVPIGTDTAFAVALLVVLGRRVPVELRVFLTATVVVDDLIGILVVALFYSGEIHLLPLGLGALVTLSMAALNRAGVYRALPYLALGILLWVLLHEAGLHATLAGVLLAICVPTRDPANLPALMDQAQTLIREEQERDAEKVLRRGPSEPTVHALQTIFERIESPADRLLRRVEPWSSFLVLPVFALANAGVVLSMDVLHGHGRLMAAVVVGLVVGKPLGIVTGALLAVKTGLAIKPPGYSWRQLVGAGLMAGIGFTMSLFIAATAFPDPGDFAAVKLAVFAASGLAALAGLAVLWPQRQNGAT